MNLFVKEDFISHAGNPLTWKIECDEFSQQHIGKQIFDVYECTEEEMLTFFDRDNDYLSGWERDQKINWVRDTITRTKIGTHE
jgi:hypothetical protein